MNAEEILQCSLCGSTNYQKFHNVSSHTICYYCYCIKNKDVKNLESFIENESFETIIKDLNFENTNSFILNYKEIDGLIGVNYHNSDFKNKNSLNILLKHGRLDNLIVPNIENLNILDFLDSSIKLLSKDGNIYIGFYTKISYLIKRKLIEHVEYIYNIYLISNLLSKNYTDLYINDFFIYGDYILLKINNKKSFKKESELQNFFDQLFFANFKKEIKYGI